MGAFCIERSQKHAVPILEKIKAILDKEQLRQLPKSSFGKAITYVLDCWPELNLYLYDRLFHADVLDAAFKKVKSSNGSRNRRAVLQRLCAEAGGRNRHIAERVVHEDVSA
jgi:hypothetical protein